jgi:hypothetical protein
VNVPVTIAVYVSPEDVMLALCRNSEEDIEYPVEASHRLLFMEIFRLAAIELQLAEDEGSAAQFAICAPVVRARYKSMFASVLHN